MRIKMKVRAHNPAEFNRLSGLVQEIALGYDGLAVAGPRDEQSLTFTFADQTAATGFSTDLYSRYIADCFRIPRPHVAVV